MESLLLDKIDQPSDLKKLNAQQVEKLCAEIRHFMLENISKTGGHLASNLGTVELTVALHRVLETPKDKIVFDVGHQCYTHKLLTGRSAGVSSPIFAVACVVAIITMHDAMGVRHETGEQAKVLNQMIAQWIDVSEKNAPFLQNMHLKEMVGHTPLQVVAGVLLGALVGFLFPVV